MTDFVDVVIVSAGISGISAAWHLQQLAPGKSYAILERREPGVIIGSFAADHVIHNLPLFQAAVREAVASAAAGYITTIGIRPTEPINPNKARPTPKVENDGVH